MTSDSSLVTHCGWCCEGGAKQHLFRLRCLINDTLISSSFSLTHCFPRKTPRILPPPPPPPISSDESKYKRHICIFWGPWMNDFAPVAPATRFQENIHPGRFREISPDFRFRFRIRNPQHTSTTKPNPREREREREKNGGARRSVLIQHLIKIFASAFRSQYYLQPLISLHLPCACVVRWHFVEQRKQIHRKSSKMNRFECRFIQVSRGAPKRVAKFGPSPAQIFIEPLPRLEAPISRVVSSHSSA